MIKSICVDDDQLRAQVRKNLKILLYGKVGIIMKKTFRSQKLHWREIVNSWINNLLDAYFSLNKELGFTYGLNSYTI